MSAPDVRNRFEDFFEAEQYITLKNYLYNYLLRKRAIQRVILPESAPRVLEVGSGLSPVVTHVENVCYSELSFQALSVQKRLRPDQWYVVADATKLPFQDGTFSHVVASEVIEHLPDDQTALYEMARVADADGEVVLTFPHRHAYYANDDRFVDHFRRYDLPDIEAKLSRAGLRITEITKVLGLLEKVIMMTLIGGIQVVRAKRGTGTSAVRNERSGLPVPCFLRVIPPLAKWANRAIAVVAWCEARIIPQGLASVLLVRARKH